MQGRCALQFSSIYCATGGGAIRGMCGKRPCGQFDITCGYSSPPGGIAPVVHDGCDFFDDLLGPVW
jgi:hypothetical protein